MEDYYYSCGDQYAASLLDWNGDLRPDTLVNGASGHIENTFRLNQYGIPANPTVPNPNPNLFPGRDLKSLPHEYRTQDVASRVDQMAKYNLDRKIRPSIGDMRDASMSHNFYDRPLDYYEARPYRNLPCLPCTKEGFLGGAELFTNEMLLLFMLILFVVLGMYCWKTMSDIKKLVKDLMQSRGVSTAAT